MACIKKTQSLALRPRAHRQLRQQILHIDQVVIEDFLGHVQEPEDLRVPNRIQHTLAIFPSDDDVAVPQNSQLLREGALLGLQSCAQIIYPDLTAAQLVQNPDSQGVSERFEEFSLPSSSLRAGTSALSPVAILR